MDTKSRNINFITKGLAILLSAVLVAAAFVNAAHFVQCADYFTSSDSVIESAFKENKTYADFQPLTDKILDDMAYLYEKTKDENFEEAALKSYLEKDRSAYIAQGMKLFNEFQYDFGIVETTTQPSEEATAAATGEAEQATAVSDNAGSAKSANPDAETATEVADEVSEDEIEYGVGDDAEFHYSYTINVDSESYTLDIRDYYAIYVTDDSAKVEEKLGAAYDAFAEEMIIPSYAYPGYVVSNDLKYYVYNRETQKELTNFTEAELASLEETPEKISLSVTDNRVTYGKGFEGVFDRYVESDGKTKLEAAEKCDFIFYIDAQSKGSYSYNSYGAMLANFNRLAGYNVKREAITGIACAVLALLILLFLCFAAGRREDDGKVKRMWLDYIPTDIHLALTGALSAGAVALLVNISLDMYYMSGYDEVVAYTAGMAALVVAVWLLLTEFLTSFVRVCRSKKGLWNNLFVVMLVKYIIVKPVSAACRGIKTALTYSPNNFRKQLKTWGALYIAANAVLLIAFLLCLAANFVFLPEFLGILMIGGNTAALVFIVSYVIKLDKIITAANLRTVPQVDYAKLPASLKMLYNSLQYTQRELDNAVTQAVKDERMRTELITNVSHDLKTPLTSIITYVDLLKQCDVQNEDAKEYIEVLDDKGRRLKRLIDDLIEASKITSGVINLQPVTLSLNELAAQAVFERQQEFVENGLELVFKGDKTNVTCYADGNKTFRIMDNLISNARKYSARGTRVYCDVYETQNFSVFEIKNISAEMLDITPQELTERFVRGDRSRNAEGNGLGLSIADNLCKAQRGKLNITIDGDLFKAQVLLPKHP